MMEVPAAGAEVPLVNAKAAVVLVGEEEVGRRAQGSAAGCCRCSRCEAVLATLLVLAALAALALGYVLYAHVHTHTPPSPQVRNGSFVLTGGGWVEQLCGGVCVGWWGGVGGGVSVT